MKFLSKIVWQQTKPEIRTTLCPLQNDLSGKGERYSPPNVEIAWCYQLHDTLRTLFACAHVIDQKSNGYPFLGQLKILESQVQLAKKRHYLKKNECH